MKSKCLTAEKKQPKKLRLHSFETDNGDDVILEDTVEENKSDELDMFEENCECNNSYESPTSEKDSFYDIFGQNATKSCQEIINMQPHDSIFFLQNFSTFTKADYYLHFNFYIKKVTKYLYIGPIPEIPKDFEAMESANITYVLNLQTQKEMRINNIDCEQLQERYAKLGIQYKNIPITNFIP